MMPMAQPVPAQQPAMQRMNVTVPQGMTGGQPLQVQTPAGLMQVTIPAGLGPGASFEILVPMVQQPAAQVAAPVAPPPQPQVIVQQAPPPQQVVIQQPAQPVVHHVHSAPAGYGYGGGDGRVGYGGHVRIGGGYGGYG